jgi:tRNA dimethylallyltransferase
MSFPKIIILSGATATGKTSISYELAKIIESHRLGVQIVNFDSVCFYKELTIGACKPTDKERGHYLHHLFDVASITQPLSANDFVELASKLIPFNPELKKIHGDHYVSILVGGSGFYLQALMEGMTQSPVKKEVREEIESWEKNLGPTFLWEKLKAIDEKRSSQLHPNDLYRIKRALEHFYSTGKTYGEADEILKEKKSQGLSPKHHWNYWHAHLHLTPDEHAPIIQKRTENLFTDGILEEVQGILKDGYSPELRPLQSIGYKQVIEMILQTQTQTHTQTQSIGAAELKDCEEKIFVATRQLAKAQRTWFKRIHHKNSFHPINEKQLLLDQAQLFLSRGLGC